MVGKSFPMRRQARFEPVDVLHPNFNPLPHSSARIGYTAEVYKSIMQVPKEHEMSRDRVRSLAHQDTNAKGTAAAIVHGHSPITIRETGVPVQGGSHVAL